MPRFITKGWIEVYDQSGGAYNTSKQIRFKTPIERSDLCDYSDAYILLFQEIMMHRTKNYLLKIIHHLLAAFQKLTIHLLIMQKT